MTSRTIKRQPAIAPRRPAPRRRQPVKKVSMLDRLVAALPISEATLHRIATWTITGAGVAVALVAADMVGLPGMVGSTLAEGAARAGFRVDQIDVHGINRMHQIDVDAVTLRNYKDYPIFAIDLERVRGDLMKIGWVADAKVSRRLPNVILVDITERVPAAIWQNHGQLALIDKTGVLLDDHVDVDAMPELPLVIGDGADREEAGYQALLAAAPALKSRIKAATWIGNRRWDLTFDSGETLALPEDGAQSALVSFAQMDGARPLLGKGWLRFDLRDPSKLVARRPGTTLAHAINDDGRPAPAATPAAATRKGEG